MLEVGYRKEVEQEIRLVRIADAPHLSKGDRARYMSQLKTASFDIMTMLEEQKYDDVKELKGLLG